MISGSTKFPQNLYSFQVENAPGDISSYYGSNISEDLSETGNFYDAVTQEEKINFDKLRNGYDITEKIIEAGKQELKDRYDNQIFAFPQLAKFNPFNINNPSHIENKPEYLDFKQRKAFIHSKIDDELFEFPTKINDGESAQPNMIITQSITKDKEIDNHCDLQKKINMEEENNKIIAIPLTKREAIINRYSLSKNNPFLQKQSVVNKNPAALFYEIFSGHFKQRPIIEIKDVLPKNPNKPEFMAELILDNESICHIISSSKKDAKTGLSLFAIKLFYPEFFENYIHINQNFDEVSKIYNQIKDKLEELDKPKNPKEKVQPKENKEKVTDAKEQKILRQSPVEPAKLVKKISESKEPTISPEESKKKVEKKKPIEESNPKILKNIDEKKEISSIKKLKSTQESDSKSRKKVSLCSASKPFSASQTISKGDTKPKEIKPRIILHIDDIDQENTLNESLQQQPEPKILEPKILEPVIEPHPESIGLNKKGYIENLSSLDEERLFRENFLENEIYNKNNIEEFWTDVNIESTRQLDNNEIVDQLIEFVTNLKAPEINQSEPVKNGTQKVKPPILIDIETDEKTKMKTQSLNSMVKGVNFYEEARAKALQRMITEIEELLGGQIYNINYKHGPINTIFLGKHQIMEKLHRIYQCAKRDQITDIVHLQIASKLGDGVYHSFIKNTKDNEKNKKYKKEDKDLSEEARFTCSNPYTASACSHIWYLKYYFPDCNTVNDILNKIKELINPKVEQKKEDNEEENHVKPVPNARNAEIINYIDEIEENENLFDDNDDD